MDPLAEILMRDYKMPKDLATKHAEQLRSKDNTNDWWARFVIKQADKMVNKTTHSGPAAPTPGKGLPADRAARLMKMGGVTQQPDAISGADPKTPRTDRSIDPRIRARMYRLGHPEPKAPILSADGQRRTVEGQVDQWVQTRQERYRQAGYSPEMLQTMAENDRARYTRFLNQSKAPSLDPETVARLKLVYGAK